MIIVIGIKEQEADFACTNAISLIFKQVILQESGSRGMDSNFSISKTLCAFERFILNKK